jgi:DNA polymerase III delta prime subunit/mRNA-degrading endonuclease toxin of MazEF toxin-antitoxin module
MKKDFDKWNNKKKYLDKNIRDLEFKEGEIWWSHFGINVGEESYGKGEYFRRPVIIIKKITQNSCIVVPVTTKIKEGKNFFNFTEDGGERRAMLYQIKFISANRLYLKKSTMSKADLEKLKKSLANMLRIFLSSPGGQKGQGLDHRISPDMSTFYQIPKPCQICYNTCHMTEHTSLYRKYRPSKFSEILGQDHIVSILQKAIENKNPNHAYIFTGSRGVGKTSIARIFARDLGVDDVDIYEIDAASVTGVDNIRELTENATVLPMSSPYKVYILDEVHMLSKQAFNAFLKGLEEPPKHVIYILATTELNKLLDTIVSRCEVHNFKKPSIEILSQAIKDVVKKEGYSIDEESTKLIALSGDESFRDTLSVLQKVMASIDGKKIENIEKILNIPNTGAIEIIIDKVLKGEKVYEDIDKLKSHNTDGKIVYDLFVDGLRLKLRTGTDKDKVLSLMTKAIENYRHIRFVDAFVVLEVVCN